MERSLALATLDAMEREIVSSPSRSCSGCQSGWTLYLDHSNGAAARYVPCGGADHAAAAQRWMVLQADHADGGEVEDSMASDASSGPRPRLREPEDDDELARRDSELRRHGFFADHRSSSYSTTSGHGSRSCPSDSGCLGSSTWSRSSQQGRAPAKGDAAWGAAVTFQGDERTATRRPYREIIVIDDDDGDGELDDTASSSAVFSCPMPMVHAR